MRYALCLVSLLALTCGACGKHEEPPAAAEPAPVAAEPAPAQPAPAAPATPEPEAKPLDPAKAQAFVTYQKKMYEIILKVTARGKELEKERKAGKFEGAVGTVKGMQAIGELGKADEQLTAARESVGLNEMELGALTEIQQKVLTREMGAGAKITEKIAEMEKAMAATPAEQRGPLMEGLAAAKQAQAEYVDLKEMRAKYGDAVVDAMNAQAPELLRLAKQASAASK